MGTFIQDEKSVALIIENINIATEKEREETELEIRLLRIKMSRLARHGRSELSDAENELLTMDAEAYQNIVYSK